MRYRYLKEPVRGIGYNHAILQHIHCSNHDSLGNGRAKIGLGWNFYRRIYQRKKFKKKYVVSKTETTNVTHCLT